MAAFGYVDPLETLWEGLIIGWGRACIGTGGLLLLDQLPGGALPFTDGGEATLVVGHFWQFVFLIPATLVALGVFALQHHAGSFAQLYRRRLDGVSHLLVSCDIALILSKLCVLLLARAPRAAQHVRVCPRHSAS